MDLEVLKKKVKSVSTNIAIYTDHLKKYKKELSETFDLDTRNSPKRLDEIDKQTKRLRGKKKRLYSDAEKILKGIKDNVD